MDHGGRRHGVDSDGRAAVYEWRPGRRRRSWLTAEAKRRGVTVAGLLREIVDAEMKRKGEI
jgi:hypothetical protein